MRFETEKSEPWAVPLIASARNNDSSNDAARMVAYGPKKRFGGRGERRRLEASAPTSTSRITAPPHTRALFGRVHAIARWMDEALLLSCASIHVSLGVCTHCLLRCRTLTHTATSPNPSTGVTKQLIDCIDVIVLAALFVASFAARQHHHELSHFRLPSFLFVDVASEGGAFALDVARDLPSLRLIWCSRSFLRISFLKYPHHRR